MVEAWPDHPATLLGPNYHAVRKTKQPHGETHKENQSPWLSALAELPVLSQHLPDGIHEWLIVTHPPVAFEPASAFVTWNWEKLSPPRPAQIADLRPKQKKVVLSHSAWEGFVCCSRELHQRVKGTCPRSHSWSMELSLEPKSPASRNKAFPFHNLLLPDEKIRALRN